MTKANRDIVYLAFGLLLVLMTAYSNHFYNGFHFDDSHAVQDNVHIRSLKNIPAFFSDPRMFSADPTHWGLRPLVTTTLALDYATGGGLDQYWFQMDTFIWFIALGVLLFFLYRNLLNKSIQHNWTSYIALGTVAWYVLHTANAETINYVIARSDVQSTLCIVASLLMYVAYPNKRNWGIYILLAVIGVFAKETVLVLVILLFFYILLFENKLAIGDLFKRSNLKVLVKAFVKVLPLLIVVAATQYYTLSKVKSIPGITNAFLPYVLTQSWVWVHYFISFFLPLNLSADTDWSVINNLSDERILIGLLFVALLVITIFKTSAKKETRPIAFGLIWFAASLLPTSLAPFAEITNDHRMFFAFVGLAFSVVTAIGLWLMKYERQLKISKSYQTLLTTCIVLVLGFNAYGVYQRNKIWHTDESLWLDVTEKSPLNGRGLMNYGLTQMEKGNYAAADIYFERATHFLPYYSTLYINIGILKGATGHPQEADANFNKAIGLSLNTFDAYAFYARYLQEQKRTAEAINMGEKALQLNAYSAMVMDVLMSAYNDSQQWDKLSDIANKKLALLPNDAQAQRYLQAAQKKTPITTNNANQPADTSSADYYVKQSMVYYNNRSYDKCIEACLQAIHIDPKNADAYSNMGAAYNSLQQWQRGADACEKALELNPNHPMAKGNLNWANQHIKK